jgi:DNA-binding PadR family transcriptional regulator
MLEIAILGLLKEGPMHGYELRKQLNQKLGLFWTVSFGSLYPTLRRLEKRGSVEKIAQTQQTSRRRQEYRITAAGETEFLELLEEGGQTNLEEEKFSLRLAFFGYLRPEMRVRLLERRKAYLQDKLEEGQRSLRLARRSRADTYTVSLVRHGVDITEADIAWLDELITAERSALERDPSGEADANPGDPPDDPTDDPTVTETELQRK